MKANSLLNTAWQETQKGYAIVFERPWPAWLSGLFIAFLALIIFMWWNTWGVAGGYANWGEWLYYSLGIYSEAPSKTPWLNGMSVSNIGIVVGALASALLSRQFRINTAPKLEYVKGVGGGVLMGIGAALAAGCNVGGFYCAMGMLDLGGVMMMVGLFGGAYLGLRYLLWEMENLPQKTMAATPKPRKDRNRLKAIIGLITIAAVFIAFQAYSSAGQTQIGGLLFFGFLIGLVMHRGRFCFANAFREPFMTGDSRMMRAVLLSLMVYALGTAVIKWSYIQPPGAGVYHPFWIGSLAGGLIFGVGMLLAGGCASGTLWRAGEGHVKLWLALIGFMASNSPAGRAIEAAGLRESLGRGVFIPEVFTWQGTMILLYFICLSLILLLLWNERTEKFVAF